MKIKKLCDLKKSDVKDNLTRITAIVETPKFLCVKCARVSNEEKHLCDSLILRK